jgi:hypothetical protein
MVSFDAFDAFDAFGAFGAYGAYGAYGSNDACGANYINDLYDTCTRYAVCDA